MNKKFLSVVLIFMIVLTTFTGVFADSGNEKVDWLVEKGYVKGDGSGRLNLNAKITRAEVAAMVARVDGLESISEALKSIKSSFNDMNSADFLWARGYVNALEGSGVINGNPDGTFKPGNNITYGEVIKMLVMVNGDVPKKIDTSGYWATPYVTKALEVGILDDIGAITYTDEATRDKIFAMVYNMVIKKVHSEQESYKAIVVGNTRTTGLDENEVDIVILEIGKNEVSSNLRYVANGDTRVIIPKEFGNSENLLGKVVDITIDKENIVKNMTIDNSYEYILDSITFMEDEIKAESSNKTYNVFLENRFTNSLDMILGTIYNDKRYDYDKFLTKYGSLNKNKELEYNVELAKITTKKEKVFFIDSYDFTDIGVVSNAEKDKLVYIYDDFRNAELSGNKLGRVIEYSSGSFKSMDINDIDKDDVIHVYGSKNSAIVLKDAKMNGKFERVLEDSKGFYVRISGKDYNVAEKDYKRAIYSMDGKDYFTLIPKDARNSLSDLRDQDVAYFSDLKGNIQMIIGDLKYNESVVTISEIHRKDIDTMDSSNKLQMFEEERNSLLYFSNSTVEKELTDFNRGDIVYLFNDGNSIEKMIRMTTANNINRDAKRVLKKSKDHFDIEVANELEGTATIGINGLGTVSIDRNTNIFMIDVDGSSTTIVKAITLNEIVSTADIKSDLRAHVITEKDFNDMKLGNKRIVGNSSKVAHTLIFTDFKFSDKLVEELFLNVSYNYNPLKDSEIVGEDKNGKRVKLDVDKYAEIPNLMYGDIIKVKLAVGNIQVAKEVEILIKSNAKEYEITEIGSRWMKVKHSKAREIEYILSLDCLIFGGYLNIGDKVSIRADKYNVADIVVIR